MTYAAFFTSVKLTDTGCDVTVNIYQVGPGAVYVYATTSDYVTKLAGDWVPQNGQVSLVCDPSRIFVLNLALAVSPDDHDAGSVSFAYTTGPFPSG